VHSRRKRLANGLAVRRRAVVGIAFLAAVAALLPASTSHAAATSADVVLVDLSADRAAVRTPYSYVYEVDNWGPDPATDVGLTAVLNGIASFEGASSDQGTCTYVPASTSVNCNIGELASGGSATIEIVATPLDGNGSTAAASNAPGEDPDSSNNSATTSPIVLAGGSADLWVYPNSGIDDSGFGSMGYAIPGEPFDYSIDVVNYGPAVAKDVTLSVLLPFGVEFQNADVACTVHSDDGANVLVSCLLGDVETGRTVSLTAVAPLGAAGLTLRTEVAVDGSGPDPGPQPNLVSNYLVIAPGLSATDESTSEAAPTLEIPVQLYGSVDHEVTVDYATADGTARADEDYSGATGTLTFAPGQIVKPVSIPLLSDRIAEKKESFTLVFSNASAASGPPVTLVDAEATATILDNDPKMTIRGPRIKERDKGKRKANFVVKLSHASPDVVSVRFATASGSARARSDFKPARKTLAFLPGQRKQVVAVLVIGDTRNERSERFFGKLSKVSGGRLSDARAAARILDDD